MLSKQTEEVLNHAFNYAHLNGHEFCTTEHVFLSLIKEPTVKDLLEKMEVNLRLVEEQLTEYISNNTPPRSAEYIKPNQPTLSQEVHNLLRLAHLHGKAAGKESVMPLDMLVAIFQLNEDNFSRFILESMDVDKLDVMQQVSHGSQPVSSNSQYVNEAGKTKKLPDFVINLNDVATEGKIDGIIGRSKEIERAIQILVRRKKNNPIFIGEAGVGKTAIAEGLAHKIVNGQVPEKLANVIILSLDVGMMLAGTKYRGDFEERMKELVAVLKTQKNFVLFVDEIHTIIGAGATSGGGTDASNMLKPMLATGQIRVMGATTHKEYKNIFEKDPALARRFHKIDVVEPSPEEAEQILHGVKSSMEEHHQVTYSDEAIKAAVQLSVKHINDRFLPDKAIDLLDEAGAMISLKLAPDNKEVTAEHVEQLIARIARIPEKNVSRSQREKLEKLEGELKMVVFGQDQAIEETVESIQMARAGLRSGEKPIGSFLFVGPTGVGKTELAKQLAQSLGVPFLRFDMSEYMEKHAVARLIGSPPGYVGYEDGGQLTDAIIKNPYSVVLMDEIEKAHPDLTGILLQVMDHGTLTDNNGRKASFKNSIVILTSNVGAREVQQTNMSLRGEKSEDIAQKPKSSVERYFTPEFRNRLDAILYFKPLEEENMIAVVDKFLAELNFQLEQKQVAISYSEEAKHFLAKKGFDKLMGARPMARVIQDLLKKPLAKEINFGKLEHGGSVQVNLENEKLVFSFTPPKQKKKEETVDEKN